MAQCTICKKFYKQTHGKQMYCSTCKAAYRAGYQNAFNQAQYHYKEKLIAVMSQRLCWCKSND